MVEILFVFKFFKNHMYHSRAIAITNSFEVIKIHLKGITNVLLYALIKDGILTK